MEVEVQEFCWGVLEIPICQMRVKDRNVQYNMQGYNPN